MPRMYTLHKSDQRYPENHLHQEALFKTCYKSAWIIYLGSGFWFKHSSINKYGFLCFLKFGNLFYLSGWWDIFNTLYVYQILESLISSYINWFNNLQFSALPVECTSYSSLAESGARKTTYTSNSFLCDNKLKGWYRFQGAAGTRMPTSCPPKKRCSTQATGWLNGGHPTVADFKVSRQVCFPWDSSCCNWSTNIEVRNCGSFYVYHFNGTPYGCALRYCGSDWWLPS